MKRVIGWILFLVVVAGFIVALQHIQEIRDWWFLRSYEPSDEIEALAEQASMSDAGSDYFYMSDPQINNKEEFNENCSRQEEALVLGCYSAQRIYVLEVEREELDGIMEVTAAHEMLHAAYHRLSDSERSKVASMLEDDFERIDDPTINGLIERYEERGGQEVRRDELHSILPTQTNDLSPELDEYYGEYFDDREALVELYEQYEATFMSIQDDIQRLQQEVEDLRNEIERLESAVDSQQEELDGIETELENLLEDDDIEGYNELVPEQNDAVERYNQLVDEYQAVIERHNQTVDELNETVILQTDLVNSMDSTFEAR